MLYCRLLKQNNNQTGEIVTRKEKIHAKALRMFRANYSMTEAVEGLYDLADTLNLAERYVNIVYDAWSGFLMSPDAINYNPEDGWREVVL